MRLDEAPGVPASLAVFKNVHLRLVPSGQDEFLVKAGAGCDLADQLNAQAQWSLDKKTWELKGALRGVKFSPSLVQLLSAFSPEFRTGSHEVETWLAHVGSNSASRLPTDPFLTADQPRQISPVQPFSGFQAQLDVDFRLKQWQAGAEKEYDVTLKLNEGEFAHPAIPISLHELRGTIRCNNRQVRFEKLVARNGSTRFGAEGTVSRNGTQRPIELNLTATDVPFEPRLRNALPLSLQRAYDLVQPAGKFDYDLRLQYNGRDRWDRETDVLLKNCNARHVKFPYLLEQIGGTLKQRGNVVDIELDGLAGKRPVELRGRVKNPGPEAEAVYEMRVAQLPLDDRFRESCSPKILKSLQLLRLDGEVDGFLRLVRRAGPGEPVVPYLWARVRNGTVKPVSFPYELRNVSGIVEGVGETSWRFQKLEGQHDGATITGNGTLLPDARGIQKLELNLTAVDMPIDQQLYQALPDTSQAAYRELSPSGLMAVTSHIVWVPGRPADVTIDGRIAGGSFEVKSFPFRLEQVQGRIKLGNGRMFIESLTGKHHETQVRFKAEGDYVPGDEWRIRLENLQVEDLDADRRFRKMLPARLRDVFETLDPRGRLTVRGMVEFRGMCEPSGGPVTAAWDLNTTYSGATLTAGVDLENLHGQIGMNGTWDGSKVRAEGKIELDSVSIKGYQLTDLRGPIRINGDELILGSEDAIKGNTKSIAPGTAAAREQITAKFIGGIMRFDGLAVLGKQTEYRVHLKLENAKLDRYAQLYLPGRNQLRGVINGWAHLNGMGAASERLAGRGQIEISPAALYELPIIVQLFQVLRLGPLDKTAFHRAFVDFAVGGRQFVMNRIDLVGDAMNLRGRGTVQFAGRTNLDFYSMMPRHQMPIPIVREFLSEATKGWVRVRVDGTMSNPVAKVQAIPTLDGTLRLFLGGGGFEPAAPTNPVPNRTTSRGQFVQ